MTRIKSLRLRTPLVYHLSIFFTFSIFKMALSIFILLPFTSFLSQFPLQSLPISTSSPLTHIPPTIAPNSDDNVPVLVTIMISTA